MHFLFILHEQYPGTCALFCYYISFSLFHPGLCSQYPAEIILGPSNLPIQSWSLIQFVTLFMTFNPIFRLCLENFLASVTPHQPHFPLTRPTVFSSDLAFFCFFAFGLLFSFSQRLCFWPSALLSVYSYSSSRSFVISVSDPSSVLVLFPTAWRTDVLP